MQTREWLADQPCVPCRAGTAPAGDTEIEDCLRLLPGWEVTRRDGVRRLERSYSVADFATALALANRIGAIADAVDHHPALLVEWGRLTVSWWTHAIGGLHRNDFVLAARCDAIAGG
jgi:4a-hydroxytetrahydrobiopterin dehydratase